MHQEKAKFLAQNLTILVPAYNEAKSVGDTIDSLKGQTCPAKEIVVIDDFSSDETGNVARAHGATVIRPPKNTGSKAGAQNFALGRVETEFTMAIDADTTLAPDAIEKLLAAFEDERVVAACGFVLPRFVRTIWERGRYIEYLFAFTFYKPVQDYFGKPLISSGCFSVYRTKLLKELGGWSLRTMAEDMDLTWTYYSKGYLIRFIPEAVCYPIEPHTFDFMRKQLRRWSHGFIQNVSLHFRDLLHIPYLRHAVAVSLWDASIASMAYLFLIPFLTLYFANPWFLLGYVIDFPATVVPVVVQAKRRKELGRALSSLPAFFVLRFVNCIFILDALLKEWILRRPLRVYEKGH